MENKTEAMRRWQQRKDRRLKARAKRLGVDDPHKLRAMPDGIEMYNGGCSEPCDMLVGPCCCGAWHSLDDWNNAMLDAIREGCYPGRW